MYLGAFIKFLLFIGAIISSYICDGLSTYSWSNARSFGVIQ